jgi:hypothetical protein
MADTRRYLLIYRAWLRWEPDGASPFPVDVYSDEREIELEAFDAIEARQRLEFKLVREGHYKPGSGHKAAYDLIDIMPARPDSA